jgi:DNA transposition AAA+ family ATPase
MTTMMKTILPSKGRTHAANSHPEAEDRQGPEDRSKFWQTNADLREQLEGLKAKGDTNVSIGKKLGYPDGTVVSKYLNDRMDRDPAEFEGRLADYVAAESRRTLAVHGEVIRTSVVRQFATFADAVRRSNAVGVFHSPAGLGKTTAIADYLEKNPTAIGVCANAAQNDATGVRQLFWAATSHRGYLANRSRWDFLVDKFKGSGRLIVVDNAQRLIGSGRDWLFDFRDATGCPMVLVGNPAILSRVAGSDQQFSRTLMEHEATLKEVESVVRQIVDAHTGDGESIYDLCYPIAKRKGCGHLRSLVMTLTAMREFVNPDEPDPRRAFEAALAKSIHHKHAA